MCLKYRMTHLVVKPPDDFFQTVLAVDGPLLTAIYCPSRMGEHSKSKSTEDFFINDIGHLLVHLTKDGIGELGAWATFVVWS